MFNYYNSTLKIFYSWYIHNVLQEIRLSPLSELIRSIIKLMDIVTHHQNIVNEIKLDYT